MRSRVAAVNLRGARAAPVVACSPMWRSRALLLLACLGLLLGRPASVPAQEGRPELRDLVLHWARGDYRAPIVCEIDGRAHRALRRVRITEGPRHPTRPTDRVIFFDLEAPPDTRCSSAIRGEEPNVIGQLLIAFEGGHRRPDIADRDFKTALQRKGGFRYAIKAGRLQLGPPGGELELHDLAGGQVRITRIERGSDTFRRLAEFGARRMLQLEVEAPGDLELRFDLVQVGD